MTSRPTRRHGSLLAVGAGERGSAALEFALVLPLVLTMTLAVLQVGLLVKDQLVLEESARAGARQGAVTTDDGSVRDTAISAAVSLDPKRLDVSVTREPGQGSGVTVAVVYHDRAAIPIVSWLFPSTVDLSAEVTMRQETG